MGNVSSGGVVGLSIAMLLAGAGIVLGVIKFFPALIGLPAAATTAATTGPGISGFLTEGGLSFLDWIPTSLFAFGFIADIIGQQFFLSMASFSGLVAVLLNSMAGYFLNKT